MDLSSSRDSRGSDGPALLKMGFQTGSSDHGQWPTQSLGLPTLRLDTWSQLVAVFCCYKLMLAAPCFVSAITLCLVQWLMHPCGRLSVSENCTYPGSVLSSKPLWVTGMFLSLSCLLKRDFWGSELSWKMSFPTEIYDEYLAIAGKFLETPFWPPGGREDKYHNGPDPFRIQCNIVFTHDMTQISYFII